MTLFTPSQWPRKVDIDRIGATIYGGPHSGALVYLTENRLPAEILDSNGIAGSTANADGSDLRASADEEGTIQLPIWVRVFQKGADAASRKAFIVVRLSDATVSLNQGSNTKVWIWYGNSSASVESVSGSFGRDATLVDCHAWFDFVDTISGGWIDQTGKGQGLVAGGTLNDGLRVATPISALPAMPLSTGYFYRSSAAPNNWNFINGNPFCGKRLMLLNEAPSSFAPISTHSTATGNGDKPYPDTFFGSASTSWLLYHESWQNNTLTQYSNDGSTIASSSSQSAYGTGTSTITAIMGGRSRAAWPTVDVDRTSGNFNLCLWIIENKARSQDWIRTDSSSIQSDASYVVGTPQDSALQAACVFSSIPVVNTELRLYHTPHPQIFTVDAIADSASSLQDRYFRFESYASDGGSIVAYEPRIRVDNVAISPPTAGYTQIIVDIASNATAATVASAIALAIDAVAYVAASANSNRVAIVNQYNGKPSEPDPGTSGFEMAIVQQGGTSSAEISGIENSINADESINYSVLNPFRVRVVVHALNYEHVSYEVIATTTGIQVPVGALFRKQEPSYVTPAITESIEYSLDLVNYQFTLNSGVTLQQLYSSCHKNWKDVNGRTSYLFPFETVTPTGYRLVNGWIWDSEATRIKIKNASFEVLSSSGVLARLDIGILSLQDIGTSQPYYRIGSGGYAAFAAAGAINQSIQVYGDTINGNLDFRNDEIEIFQRTWGYFYSYARLSDSYSPPWSVTQSYLVVVGRSLDPNITDTELTVSGWSDVVVTFSPTTFDFDGDTIAESWDATVDGAGRTVRQVYERLQWLQLQSTTLNGVDGRLYTGVNAAYPIVSEGAFGVMRGSTLFGAQGVLISNVSDPVNLSLVDSGGTTRIAPVSVTATFKVVFRGGLAPVGYEWRLYQDDPTPGIIGTIELAGDENETSTTVIYNYQHTSDIEAVFQVIPTGFVEVNTPVSLGSSNQTITVISDFDLNL